MGPEALAKHAATMAAAAGEGSEGEGLEAHGQETRNAEQVSTRTYACTKAWRGGAGEECNAGRWLGMGEGAACLCA